MKRFIAIVILCLFFGSAFTASRGMQTHRVPEDSDTLQSVYLYTEGVKQNTIHNDSAKARQAFIEAINRDSTYAPAYYELAGNIMHSNTLEATKAARAAYLLDSTNKWYMGRYGQLLVMGQQYGEARNIYLKIVDSGSNEPNDYRVLSALYDQAELPYSAIATLDSAEVRFGKIPLLSEMKRRLLISTRQMDKAVTEAKMMIEATPYEAENHTILGELYSLMNKDSLALEEFNKAIKIDSTNIATLMTMSEYYNRKQDYRNFLHISKQIFWSDELDVDRKIKQFEAIISDKNFYRDYFIQISDLALALVIKYPNNTKVIDLYANNLIASGALKEALELYKRHLEDRPAVKSHFKMVVDIESYMQRPDSVDKYIGIALEQFPDDVDFRLWKGHSLAYAKDHDQAIAVYKKTIPYAKTDSLHGVIWGFIGDVYHQKSLEPKGRGMMKKAYAAYDKSLSHYSNNPLVLNNYAYFLSEENKQLEKALDMSGRAIALSATNPTYIDTYAWVLFKLGRTAEAKKNMQQAVSLDRSNSPELQLHYGDILSALGENFMAEVYWRKALENGYDKDEIMRRIDAQNSK